MRGFGDAFAVLTSQLGSAKAGASCASTIADCSAGFVRGWHAAMESHGISLLPACPHACAPAWLPGCLSLQDRISPAWEMIPALQHIFFMLCEPLHSVTCFELPVYVPSEAERKDPKLYARNVRQHMVSAAWGESSGGRSGHTS